MQSEEATREVGQEYVLNTFDMGGCMTALPYVWRFPGRYQKHVITPGLFHTGMDYIGMITAHKCNCSGYSEILIEAQLLNNGCLNLHYAERKSIFQSSVLSKNRM